VAVFGTGSDLEMCERSVGKCLYRTRVNGQTLIHLFIAGNFCTSQQVQSLQVLQLWYARNPLSFYSPALVLSLRGTFRNNSVDLVTKVQETFRYFFFLIVPRFLFIYLQRVQQTTLTNFLDVASH
jgi:hypothetical protein